VQKLTPDEVAEHVAKNFQDLFEVDLSL
jgi:hypothetical protein